MTERVRPLDVEPEARRRGPLLIAVAVLILAGFGLFLATGPSPLSAPTTTSGVTTTSPSADTSPPINGTATDTELRRLVPGFQGRIRGVLASEDGSYGWTWSSGEPTPRLTELAPDAVGSWDGSTSRIAVIADSSFGRSLYYGPPTDVREVHNGVDSFAWHDSVADSVAWLSLPEADGRRELWRSLSGGPQGSFSASLVARFDFDASLVGYGDWGFALQIVSPSEPIQLATYTPNGELISLASGVYSDSTSDGSILVVTGAESAAPPQLAITSVDLGGRRPIGPPATPLGVFSPNGKWVATVAIDPAGTALWLVGVDPASEDEPIPLGVELAFAVAWSSDGRWVLLTAGVAEPAQRDDTLLLFVDTESRRVHPVDVEGLLTGLAIESTGGSGPTRYYLP